MKRPSLPVDESGRLQALADFEILDTISEDIYDNLTKLAAKICGTPIALISLIDENRQWFKSRFGLEATETPRDVSFCGHAILTDDEIFEIADAKADPRFSDNPLVDFDPRVIFYAGAPLKTRSGHKVGTLCVIDHEPRRLTKDQRESLRLLADQVTSLLEMRARNQNSAESFREQLEVSRQQERSQIKSDIEHSRVSADRQMLETIFETSSNGLALIRGNNLVFERVNHAFELLVGDRVYIGKNWVDVYTELADSVLPSIMLRVLETGERYEIREAEFEILNDEDEREMRIYDFSYTRVNDEEERPYGILIQSTDVTRDVHAKKQISDLKNKFELSSQLFQTTLVSIGDAVISTTADEIPKVRFLNKVAENLTGWDLNSAIGKPVSEVFRIVNAKTRAPAIDPISKVISTGKIQGLANHTALISKSGREYIIEDSAAPLQDDAGNILGVVLVFRDVTDQHALEEQSLLLNAVIESSKDFIGIAKPDGQAFYVNPAGRELLGLSNYEEIKTTQIIDYFAESEKARIISDVMPQLLSAGSWDGRVLFKNFRSGEEIPFSWNAFSIPDTETGGIAAISCVSKDLRDSERKQSIVDAEQSKLLNLLSQMPIGVCLLEGPHHRYTFANPRYYDLFKGERQLIGKTVTEALPEIAASELPKILDSVYLTGIPYYGNEFAVEIADVRGSLQSLFLNFSYEPMRDATGTIYGISVTVMNVTDLVRSRKTLEQKDVRLSLALSAGKIGTWDLDTETRELVWSRRGADMYGFYDTLVTSYETFLLRVHPDDRARVDKNVRDSTSENGQDRYDLRYRIILPNGGIRTIQADGLTVFEEKNGGRQPILFTGTVIDVTDQVNARAEILAAKESAEKANSAKSSFLANMSHEIRSPLGAIMGFSDLMKSQDLQKDELQNFVAVIDRNSHHLLRVVDDILDLAKVEAGKMMIEHIEFSLSELLADFASLMGFRAREKGIEFELRLGTPLPDLVVTDPTRLRQILNNVVGNAIKFTERGRVAVTILYDSPSLSFRVTDTGPGISNEDAARLFQPFEQADISTTRKFGGTGLGLVLTRRLSQALGGNFVLESSVVDQGSSFLATISVETPAHARLIEKKDLEFVVRSAAPDLSSHQALKKMKVLVVDDSPDNQVLFRLILSKLGADVDVGQDGFEGVNMALANHYDVVLMDVQMPRMDGHEATRALRSKGYKGPIVALTAHAMKEERERAIASGFDQFLSKPVHRDALVSLLENIRNGFP